MAEPGSELAVPETLPHPRTGELLPATPENAAEVARAAKEMRERLLDVKKDAERVLLAESERIGARTFSIGGLPVKVTSDDETVWDVEALRRGLRRVMCPEERIEALIVPTIEYKVNGTVARQLSAASSKYKAVIERAKTRIRKPPRVSV